MLDHVHMMIAIPPKYAVSQVVGYIMEDPRDGRSLEATTHWFVGNRTRIAFESGAVLEAWYALP